MNIKSVNGKVIHTQKKEYRTVCERSLTIRLFNRQTGLFETTPHYLETNEEITCEKCKNIVGMK